MTPFRNIDGVDAVDQRALRRPLSRTWITQSAEQLRPPLFDQPSQSSARKSLAQRDGRGQSVNDVSKSPKSHDEQAVESRRVGWGNIGAGHSCPHGFRGSGRERERMISVAE